MKNSRGGSLILVEYVEKRASVEEQLIFFQITNKGHLATFFLLLFPIKRPI